MNGRRWRRVVVATLLTAMLVTAGCGVSSRPLASQAALGPTVAPTFTPRPQLIKEIARPYAGGRYTLQVPSNWNGGLVLYAHGYEGEREGPGELGTPDLGSWWLAQGYGWAASSYRSAGYRVDWFIEDMLALRALVLDQLGRPRWLILYGQSMGGHVATSSLELHPGMYDGAMAECGVVDGVGEGDYQVAYAAAAEYISRIPLLDPPDPDTFRMNVGRWLQVMGQPGRYTDKGRQFDSVIKHLAGGDLPERIPGLMGNRYVANLGPHVEPSRAPTSMPIRRAVDTRPIRFHIDAGLGLSDEDLNASVRRFAPAPEARSRELNPVFADLTGRLSAPLLTIHTTGDAWVPMRLEQEYRRKTIAAGTEHLLVQRATQHPGHCDFSAGERQQAFTDLVGWIERGIRPAGEDVLAADVSTLGLRWTLP
ncbi:MAG: lysophospholipase [Chloroflexota bacterium]|nr:lysophospholipase [Chloroflexota bacterium]